MRAHGEIFKWDDEHLSSVRERINQVEPRGVRLDDDADDDYYEESMRPQAGRPS